MTVNNYLNSQVNMAQTQAFWEPSRLQQLTTTGEESAKLETAAKEFASLMFHMMVKSMRDAGKSFNSQLCSSAEHQHYTELMDQQWAVHLAHTENNQLVAAVVKQFSKFNGTNSEVTQANSLLESKKLTQVHNAPETTELVKEHAVEKLQPLVTLPRNLQTTTIAPPQSKEKTNFVNRDDFINTLLPYAINVAKTIGMDPKLLLAQAALETGWGGKIAKLANGTCSHNLFGIKASNDWQGKKVATKTLEYSDGIAQRKTAWFRAYDSFGESMEDYAKFLQNSSRYQQPIVNAHIPEVYVQELQNAGFATDPQYAKKILQIYHQME